MLGEIQEEFARALRDPELPSPGSLLKAATSPSDRRFDVYRNNMVVNTVEALKSTFPAVRALVGNTYFEAAARAYIAEHPPDNPVLLQYGGSFGEFLERLPTASKAPYIGDVARLEWGRIFALNAMDAEPCGIERLAEVSASLTSQKTLTLHPSLVLVRSRWPVVSLWSACQVCGEGAEVDMKKPEQFMAIRPSLHVEVRELALTHWMFLDALHRGDSLGVAARRAIDTSDEFDLVVVLQAIFELGCVVSIAT